MAGDEHREIERQLIRLARRHKGANERLAAERDEAIRHASQAGLSYRRIGRIWELSHQRIGQIIHGSR